MFDWLFLLFFAPVAPPHVTPPKKEYVGMVAAEAAYVAMLPDKKEVKPDRPIDPNCKTCSGTGKVRSGDGISWTKCPTCQAQQAIEEQPRMEMQEPPEAPKPSMRLQVKPLPTPKTSACPTGACPLNRG